MDWLEWLELALVAIVYFTKVALMNTLEFFGWVNNSLYRRLSEDLAIHVSFEGAFDEYGRWLEEMIGDEDTFYDCIDLDDNDVFYDALEPEPSTEDEIAPPNTEAIEDQARKQLMLQHLAAYTVSLTSLARQVRIDRELPASEMETAMDVARIQCPHILDDILYMAHLEVGTPTGPEAKEWIVYALAWYRILTKQLRETESPTQLASPPQVLLTAYEAAVLCITSPRQLAPNLPGFAGLFERPAEHEVEVDKCPGHAIDWPEEELLDDVEDEIQCHAIDFSDLDLED